MHDQPHQYVDRHTARVLDERLFGDRIVRFLYSQTREQAPALFRMVTGPRVSELLGYLNFDLPLASHLLGNQKFLRSTGVDLSECLSEASHFTTPRRLFERQIRYWECRKMPADSDAIVSPADARVVVGSLAGDPVLKIKETFFVLDELLGGPGRDWLDVFRGGTYAIFRLTPEKYHYNHTPVAGRVVDFYPVTGAYHSCNPAAVVEVATPYSKNKRVVTIIDTDVPGGTHVGLVAMIEVVALMIGDVVSCYSSAYYQEPREIGMGLFLEKGQPKSLFRPGSSTTILLFERDRIDIAPDLAANTRRTDVNSRYTAGFGQPIVETDVAVRSLIASRRP